MPVPNRSGVAIRFTKFHFSPKTLMRASNPTVLTNIVSSAKPTSRKRRKITAIMPSRSAHIGTSMRVMSSFTRPEMAGLKRFHPLSQMPSPFNARSRG